MTIPRTLTCDEVLDLAPLFVTGALEPAEADAVRAHLANCAQAHDEVLELGEAATALLETVEPAEPPARLKASVLAAAAADLETGRHPAGVAASATGATPPAPAPGSITAPAAHAAPVPAPGPSASSGVVELGLARARRSSRLGWMLAAAAVLVVLALGAWNVALRRDLDGAQAYRAGVSAALDLAATPGATTALLSNADGSVSGLAVVGADGSVRLAMQGLAATSGSQVYTAWAIERDGAPVPIGDFTVGADGVAVAAATAPGALPGATLALTLEPAPGATTPTLPIVAAGTTRPASG